MSKQPYFTKTVTTKRITDIAGTDNQDWQDNLSGIICNIQPLDDSFNEDLEGSYGKDYLMHTDIADIIVGDKIVDGTDEYLVKGVRSFQVMSFSVMELKIRICQ